MGSTGFDSEIKDWRSMRVRPPKRSKQLNGKEAKTVRMFPRAVEVNNPIIARVTAPALAA